MKPGTYVHLVGGTLTLLAAVAWSVTGREGFTRWPDQRLSNADAAPSPVEDALLAEVGFNEGTGEQKRPDIQSRFALGLLPSGSDAAHLLSIATVGVAAMGLSCLIEAKRFIHRSQSKNINGETP